MILIPVQNPVSMSFEQQKDILNHTYDLLTKFNNGVPPKGSVAPWWETSKEGTVLLLDKGIEYGKYSTLLVVCRQLITHVGSNRSLQHGA